MVPCEAPPPGDADDAAPLSRRNAALLVQALPADHPLARGLALAASRRPAYREFQRALQREGAACPASERRRLLAAAFRGCDLYYVPQ